MLTGIRETKKGRYALFCGEGEFICSVDGETLAEYALHAGEELRPEVLRKLRDESDFRRAKAKAFELLGTRAHTKKELEEKLRKQFDEETAGAAAAAAERLGYIDDRAYAAECAEHVCRRRKMSRRAAERYLREKGIGKEETERALAGYAEGDAARIRELLERRYQMKLTGPNGFRNTAAALQRRGFAAEDIRAVLAEFGGSETVEE